MNNQQQRLTEQAYWDRAWEAAAVPNLVDPSDRRLANSGNIAFHHLFSETLGAERLEGGSLIEVGCAQSKWLPYFARVHGLAVTGIDYSELGCARARRILHEAQCQGDVVQTDVFNPPVNLLSRFDVVLSMGLVEHFADTSSAIAACAALAKPGGIVITTIPNMCGIVGLGQRWLDRSVYEKHVPLDRETLRRAHEQCGLTIERSQYLLPANFCVINHSNLRPPIVNDFVRGVLAAATVGVWGIDRYVHSLRATRLFSPYVACVGRTPAASRA